jgi:hypothetical protein
VCIGFSSAPFYLPEIECNIFEPSEECISLESKTTRLYLSEFLYGGSMMFQGTIGLILVDEIKSLKLALLLRKTCKIGLVFYIFCAILRIGLYFDVHSAITVIDVNHEDYKGLGSFFAEYISNTTGSTITTIILMVVFFSFYLSNYYVIKQMNRMIDFVNA